MGILDWLINKTNKTDNNSITDSDVDLLLDTPGIVYPTVELRQGIKQQIIANWPHRGNKKPIEDLIRELAHPCTKYQLEATFNEKSQFIRTYTVLKKLDNQAAINTNFLAVAKIFTDGFMSLFKDNFIIKNGKIVDVKPVNTDGEPDPRFTQCRESLEESRKYARNESNAFKSNQGLNRNQNQNRTSNSRASSPPTTPDPTEVEGDRNRASPPSFGGYKRHAKTKRRHTRRRKHRHTRRHTHRRRSKKSFNS
jgi:hypothetical protein